MIVSKDNHYKVGQENEANLSQYALGTFNRLDLAEISRSGNSLVGQVY